MSFRDKPEDLSAAAEEYELSSSHDPLLARYAGGRSPDPEGGLAIGGGSTRRRLRRRGLIIGGAVAMSVLVPMGVLACMPGAKLGEWEVPSVNGWKHPGNQNPHFPTYVGYPGPTPTGSEAFLLATASALPLYDNVHPLVPPSSDDDSKFNIIKHWGNLSPYHSVKSHGLPESSQVIPDGCTLDEMHWLQRHGARYPTSSPGGPAGLAMRLQAAKGWIAEDDLAFLNEWNYKLGAELLTPFGRAQLYNLGAAARIKYGYLLERMEGRKPVFRTESQDRMLRSAQNFAAGFFGIPVEDQYNLEIMIEAPGFNCSLSPYHSCPNDLKVYPHTREKLAQWDAVFLKKARKRLSKMIKGYEVTLQDAKGMMDMCAYETVALGYSKFCDLFTEKEWRGYEYASDIYWWYSASFGAPVARAEGLGWLQELTARLTHTHLTQFNSSVNSTLHNDIHFPLNDPLYVDFTHDTTFAQLLPTMNLTSFAAAGPPPLDHIPKHWPFVASKFSPFATNMQVQVLTCDADALSPPKHKADDDDDKRSDNDRYVRLILNDAPVPLTGINGCVEDAQGLCALDAFVSSMQTLIGEIDFAHDCFDDYTYDPNEIVNGSPRR